MGHHRRMQAQLKPNLDDPPGVGSIGPRGHSEQDEMLNAKRNIQRQG